MSGAAGIHRTERSDPINPPNGPEREACERVPVTPEGVASTVTGRTYGEAGGGPIRRLPSTSPLFVASHPASPESALLSGFITRDGLHGEAHEAQFKGWALKQVERNAHIGAVYRSVIDRMKREDRPATVALLLEHAQGAARASLEQDPSFPEDSIAAQHLVMLSALVGLAAHALQSNKGEVTCLFPRYIPDGRAGEAGFDKSWHLIDHAMFAYVHLFDRTYGSGELARDFAQAVKDADRHDAARHIAAAYERLRGACGGLAPGTLPGPVGEETVYFAPPEWASGEEREAYELAVRIGDAHEYSPDFGDPSQIGTNHLWADPLAEIQATFDVYSTLRDAGSLRDLTANRIGAWLGTMAFRDPRQPPGLPYDDGAHAAGQTYAAGRPVPSREYLGLELYSLARVRDPNGDPKEMLARAMQEAEQIGPEEGVKRVAAELSDLVDSLIDVDRDKLARYYATYSIRYLQFGWRVPIDGEERAWRPHFDYASGISRETLMHHFLRRLAATARAFDPPVQLEVPEIA